MIHITIPRLAAISVFVTLVLVGTGAVAPDDKPATQDATIPPLHQEKPDDKPGTVPPQRVSPAARPLSPAGVDIVQVNVNAQGMNIVGDAANEPSIAVDPNDPSRITIGWRQFDTVQSNFRQAGWGWSDDEGQSWTFPGKIEAGNFRSDPVLESDDAGVFYYYSLRGDFLCDFFLSEDSGRTWGPRIPAHGGDKQWFTIDTTGGVGNGHVYGTWSVLFGCCGDRGFFRATDGLGNVEQPIRVPLTPVWGAMCVGPDGTAFVTGAEPFNESSFVVARSRNARNAGQTPVFEHVTAISLGGSQEAFRGVNPGGLLGQVWIAANHNNSEVYLLCSVDPPGSDPLDVMFARSEDNGETWSAPVRINDVQNGWQWFGTMSVAPSGRIDAVWNDTRNDGSSTFSELFYAFSTDGGRTWSPSIQISPRFNHFLGYPQQNKLGDYYDMASLDDAAYLAWAATFNGEQDVYFTRIVAPGESAVLTDFEVVTGVLLDGDVSDLESSNDSYVHTRSGFGRTFTEAHLLEMLVSAATTVDSPLLIDVTIESFIDEPAGTAKVALRNVTTNQFEQVGQYSIGDTEETVTIANIDAMNRVSNTGEIDLRIKHVVFVPFLAFTFDSFFDQVEMIVR